MKNQETFKISPDTFGAICNKIYAEIQLAEQRYPGWPIDILHDVAIVNEEAGELTKACLQYVYAGEPQLAIERDERKRRISKEAIQVAAMAIRFMCGSFGG